MKNFLILYLLVLSHQINAQNSSFSNRIPLSNDPGKPFLNLDQLLVANLIPVDANTDATLNNQWLLHNEPLSRLSDPEGFSTIILIDQLEKLNKSTPFNVRHNATLERFIRVYLNDHREYLNKILGKSAYYFPVFEKYLDAYELPLELKYLAIVESALNQVAVSPSGAKGLWQFMYGTGREYDLYIDSYVDERFDLIKSTQAACLYLKSLYKTFGDWDLALAAYNSGPGNVKKAIKRAGGKNNYWEIRQFLPRETSSYVPAFYATMYLLSYADYHNLSPLKNQLSYREIDTVHVKGLLTFASISELTGIDPDALRLFNPQYKQDLIPDIKNKIFSLALPVQLIPDFLSAERELYQNNLAIPEKSPLTQVIPVTLNNSYLVTVGDNLNSIAKKHGISLEELKSWNGLDTNFLIAGQRLVVTDQILTKPNPVANLGPKELPNNKSFGQPSGFTTYIVEHGDTLFKISRKYGNIPIADIRNMNQLHNVNYLKPGTSLKIRTVPTSHENKPVGKS